jgi:hypothetical protein
MDPCSEAFLGHVQAEDTKAKSRSRSDAKSERVKMLEKQSSQADRVQMPNLNA